MLIAWGWLVVAGCDGDCVPACPNGSGRRCLWNEQTQQFDLDCVCAVGGGKNTITVSPSGCRPSDPARDASAGSD
jgi:hypothetical protein